MLQDVGVVAGGQILIQISLHHVCLLCILRQLEFDFKIYYLKDRYTQIGLNWLNCDDPTAGRVGCSDRKASDGNSRGPLSAQWCTLPHCKQGSGTQQVQDVDSAFPTLPSDRASVGCSEPAGLIRGCPTSMLTGCGANVWLPEATSSGIVVLPWVCHLENTYFYLNRIYKTCACSGENIMKVKMSA